MWKEGWLVNYATMSILMSTYLPNNNRIPQVSFRLKPQNLDAPQCILIFSPLRWCMLLCTKCKCWCLKEAPPWMSLSLDTNFVRLAIEQFLKNGIFTTRKCWWNLNRINSKFKLGKQILQIKSFILSKTKTKYIRCNIIYSKTRTKDIVKLNKQDVPIGKNFKYLTIIIQQDEEFDKHVVHIVKKWMIQVKREVKSLLWPPSILKIKRKFLLDTC